MVWLGALGLAALGVAYVVLGARRRGTGDARRRTAQAAFVERAREIRAEGLAQGLPAEQVAALEHELALDLLAGDNAAPAAAKTRPPALPSRALLAAAVAGGALALGLYAWWGDPHAPRIVSALAKLADEDAPQLAALAPVLTARAHRRPNDANTWLHLAGVYMRLADYEGAAAAFAHAHELVGPDPHVDLAWAQARLLADRGAVSPATREIAARVLARSPDHPQMRELLAMGDLRAGDFASAARHVASLLRQDLPAERRRLLENMLALARERQGAERVYIEVVVTVAAPVADVAAPWLMVLARPAGGGGPVAATRQPARDRQTVVLDDANAMLAGSGLSQSGLVEVVARLSPSGSAADSDVEAVSKPLDPATRPRVELTLRLGAAKPAPNPAAGVSVRVSLAAQVDAGTPVFVIARAIAGRGPPVAVRRLRAGDLPMRVVLTDADAMLPGQRLSALEEVQVIARASLGGTPSARRGDVESAATRTRVGAAEVVELRIEHALL